MKVIFLDIDGVLNNIQHCNYIHENIAPGHGFGQSWELDRGNFNDVTLGWDSRNVSALKYILYETNAKIVISSTWRKGRTTKFFRNCFSVYNLNPDIIGFTPEIFKIGTKRGDEVNAWLKRHERDVTNWVCLDDDGDFYPENNLIQTDLEVGLTWADAERAIDILKGK